MTSRRILILAAVAGLGLAALWFARNHNATSAPTSNVRPSAKVADGAGSAVTPRRAKAASVSGAASAPSAYVPSAYVPSRPLPHIPSPALPVSLADAAMSSDMASQLTRRLEQHPNSRNHIDYKLGLLARVRECLGTDVQASGQVDVILHFAVDPEGRSAKGTQIEITDSTLPPEVDRRLRQCATKLHLGQPITLAQMDPGSPVYYWGTKFVVPTEDDRIYGWFR